MSVEKMKLLSITGKEENIDGFIAEYLLDSDGNIAGVRDNSALNNTSNAITQCTVEVNPTTNSYSLNNYKLDLGEYKLSIGEHVYFYCTQSGGNSLVMQNGSSPSSGFNEGQFANIHNGVTTVGGGILNGDDVYITLKFMKYNY